MDGKIFLCSYAVCLRVWESEHSCKEYWRTLVDSQSSLVICFVKILCILITIESLKPEIQLE